MMNMLILLMIGFAIGVYAQFTHSRDDDYGRHNYSRRGFRGGYRRRNTGGWLLLSAMVVVTVLIVLKARTIIDFSNTEVAPASQKTKLYDNASNDSSTLLDAFQDTAQSDAAVREIVAPAHPAPGVLGTESGLSTTHEMASDPQTEPLITEAPVTPLYLDNQKQGAANTVTASPAYYLQLTCGSDLDNAWSAAEKLAKQHSNAVFLAEAPGSPTCQFKVILGPFEDEQQARQARTSSSQSIYTLDDKGYVLLGR